MIQCSKRGRKHKIEAIFFEKSTANSWPSILIFKSVASSLQANRGVFTYRAIRKLAHLYSLHKHIHQQYCASFLELVWINHQLLHAIAAVVVYVCSEMFQPTDSISRITKLKFQRLLPKKSSPGFPLRKADFTFIQCIGKVKCCNDS